MSSMLIPPGLRILHQSDPQACAGLPDITFVLRPHPVERNDVWKRLIGNYPNIVVTNDGGVGSWIRQSLALIHNGCTTAMEAVKADVPVLTFLPMPDRNDDFYFRTGWACSATMLPA